MKKLIIGIVAALVAVITAVSIYSVVTKDKVTESDYVQEVQSGNAEENNKQQVEDDTNKDDTKKEEEKVYTPTFMYFISNSDENFEETNKIIDELKKEYETKVTFDIVNITENPEAKDNFPVEGQTPALIMLNTSNDISSFNFKCRDKAVLKDAIEAALQK